MNSNKCSGSTNIRSTELQFILIRYLFPQYSSDERAQQNVTTIHGYTPIYHISQACTSDSFTFLSGSTLLLIMNLSCNFFFLSQWLWAVQVGIDRMSFPYADFKHTLLHSNITAWCSFYMPLIAANQIQFVVSRNLQKMLITLKSCSLATCPLNYFHLTANTIQIWLHYNWMGEHAANYITSKYSF